MNRHFFHTDHETRTSDAIGVELPSMDAARQEASMYAAELLRDGAVLFWGSQPWSMTVTDDSGLIFFTLEVTACDAPAAGLT